MSVLVTGFGSFPGVDRNPTEALALAVDGRLAGRVPVVGRVLPVSYQRAPALVARAAEACEARLVLCLGVAMSRTRVEVERVARRALGGSPDVDGVCLTVAGEGPETVRATLDVDRLAAALGAEISDDAGAYVCNALLYDLGLRLRVPVGFVHVPAAGMEPERLLAGLRVLLGEAGADDRARAASEVGP